ncbi:hypothetical protein [Serratia sp. UGAL515B_01]|uniref:hypothetical protein n=1 Tax=Serratia sp. UGAL515B_01 TaxID=2986763 RepID=UPI002954FDAF|nr:hypothetical protein [Serratia sp. UGAL515B_01]WON76741.1 hypothetical protein OK023_16350 [Serratia sp. UGAL515B_01]
MSKICWLWLLLSTLLGAVQYRDPFQSAQVIPCKTPTVSPTDWLLKGIIGSPDFRQGWVVTPLGQWLRLLPQQWLPGEYWQVESIHSDRIELRAKGTNEGCLPQGGSVVLTLQKKP